MRYASLPKDCRIRRRSPSSMQISSGRDLTAALDRADRRNWFVVLEASSLVEIDYSAALALRDAIETCRSRGIDFAVARLELLRAQDAFERFGVMRALGPGTLSTASTRLPGR